MKKRSICYLLESTALGGGVKVIFDQAVALAKRGHKVIIRARAGEHKWYPYPLRIRYLPNLDAPFAPDEKPDVLICTYWTTVAPAMNLNIRSTFHLCQGYEGAFPELAAVKNEIEKAYKTPIPVLTIGDWLTHRLQEIFGSHSFDINTIGQVVDTRLYRPSLLSNILKIMRRRLLRRPVSILMIGDSPISCKGISYGLHAICLLREKGWNIRLTRIALHPIPPEEEKITPIDFSHTSIPPRNLSALYRKADLLLACSLSDEGFGLPLAEALASALPAVATRIPSFLSFDERQDYAAFVEERDAEGMSEAAALLLEDRRRYASLQRRGPALIRTRFSPESVARKIEAAICRHEQETVRGTIPAEPALGHG